MAATVDKSQSTLGVSKSQGAQIAGRRDFHLPKDPQVLPGTVQALQKAGLSKPIKSLDELSRGKDGGPSELTLRRLNDRGFKSDGEGGYVWRSPTTMAFQGVYFTETGINLFSAVGATGEQRARLNNGSYIAEGWSSDN